MATRRPSLPRLLLACSGWSLLALLLALQLHIAAAGGFRIPDLALRLARDHLLARGLDVRVDSIWLDPSGRILIHRPRISVPGHPDPVATARAVHLRLDWRLLLSGSPALHHADLSDLTLGVPASLTPDNTARSLLTGGEFRLSHPSAAGPWLVEQASARVLGVPTAFHGRLPTAKTSPASPASAPATTPPRADDRIRTLALRLTHWHDLLALFPLADLSVLRIELTEDRLIVGGEADQVRLPTQPRLPHFLADALLTSVTVRAELHLPAPDRPPADHAHLLADHIQLPSADLSLHDTHLLLVRGENYRADLSVGSISAPHLAPTTSTLVATARLDADASRLDADLGLRLADTAWTLSLRGDPRARSGHTQANGTLTPALLDLARPHLPAPARPILEITDPVRLHLAAEIDPGGRPVEATARLLAGRAVAGRVPFDHAAGYARYTFADRQLRAHDLLLVQGDSQATGTYEMDAGTLAFRFLLAGSLRPMGIEGWFSGWWDRLWDDFTFGPRPPAADVDIQGVWKQADRTQLFIGASSDAMRLRDLDLCSLHTRVWIEHGLVDVLGFRALAGPAEAQGRFTRHQDPGADDWSRLVFDLRSTFPADALPKLFPAEGPALIAPFAFSSPPLVHLVGETHRTNHDTTHSPAADYRLHIATDTPLRFQNFPLQSLSVQAVASAGELRLENLRAAFAGGTLDGRAVLSGPADDRWLALDLRIQGADLDSTQNTWREYQAARSSTPPTSPPKPLGGSLDLSLAATGPLDNPLAYSGTGTGRIVDGNLAAIRLFGPFSSMLAQTGIGIGTVRLHTADARFTLAGSRLHFSPLEIAGDSAQVHAQGTYDLTTEKIDFTAKLRPFQNQDGFISGTADLVLAPFSSVLGVHLDGTLDKPTWRFQYGPSQWLRRLTGPLTGNGKE